MISIKEKETSVKTKEAYTKAKEIPTKHKEAYTKGQNLQTSQPHAVIEGKNTIPKQESPFMGQESRESVPWQIYDRIFKRIFTLSDQAITNLINGLFQENFPLDSKVEYRNSEFISPDLDNRIADIFVTIAGKRTFHLEAQMTSDSTIILRVFEYGFMFAMSTQSENNTLHFPEPAVIYLNRKQGIPEKSTLHISFGNQGSFDYQVRNFLYLSHHVNELDAKNLVVLIPFQALRLRNLLNQALKQNGNGSKDTGKIPYTDKIQQLQEEICHDIISSINKNLKLGNITPDDANQLLELTNLLHMHICNHFKRKGGTIDMKPLLPGAIELPNDKYRRRIDTLERELAKYKKYKAESNYYKEESDHYKKESDHYKEESDHYKEKSDHYKEKSDHYKKESDHYKEENERLKKLVLELETKQ